MAPPSAEPMATHVPVVADVDVAVPAVAAARTESRATHERR